MSAFCIAFSLSSANVSNSHDLGFLLMLPMANLALARPELLGLCAITLAHQIYTPCVSSTSETSHDCMPCACRTDGMLQHIGEPLVTPDLPDRQLKQEEGGGGGGGVQHFSEGPLLGLL